MLVSGLLIASCLGACWDLETIVLDDGRAENWRLEPCWQLETIVLDDEGAKSCKLESGEPSGTFLGPPGAQGNKRLPGKLPSL